MRVDGAGAQLVEQICRSSDLGQPVAITARTGGELSGIYEVSTDRQADPLIVKVYAQQWQWKQPKELHVYRIAAPAIGWATPDIIDSKPADNPSGQAYTVMTKIPAFRSPKSAGRSTATR